MSRLRTLFRRPALVGLLVILETAALVAVVARQRWQAAGVSAVARGRQVAEHLGCFACHGPGGVQGVANPGSEETQVPAWSGGTAMMYVNDENDIREWILAGKPRDHEHEEHEGAEQDRPLLHMPAYKGLLTKQELADLVAYYEAVAWFPPPKTEIARAGMEVALGNGCFGCHGPAGKGGVSNPGSFKGYVPGWDSPDYAELVKNDNELREWILAGVSRRFARNPAAQVFLQRAPLKMPKYRGVLGESQIRKLQAYIRYLRSQRKQAAPEHAPSE